jgi:hypothetical protein
MEGVAQERASYLEAGKLVSNFAAINSTVQGWSQHPSGLVSSSNFSRVASFPVLFVVAVQCSLTAGAFTMFAVWKCVQLVCATVQHTSCDFGCSK